MSGIQHNPGLSRAQFRRMLAGLSPALSICLAFGISPICFGQNQQETKVQKTETSVIVLSDKEGGKEKILEQLREKLKMLPEDQREKILKQVTESLGKAEATPSKEQRIVVATVDADGKPVKADGNVVTMTIVQDGQEGKNAKNGEARTRVEARVRKLEDLKNREGSPLPKEIQEKLKGQAFNMVLKAMPGIEGSEMPKFRIGLSVENPETGTEDKPTGDAARGLVVERVMEDTPASQAGIKEGDVIVAINGQDAKDFASLQQAVQEAGNEDRALKLKIQRKEESMILKVKPTKSEESGALNFEMIPSVGSVFPLDMIQGQNSGAIQIMGLNSNAQQSDSATKKEIAELREEIQELKSMVKKLLESANNR